MGLKRKDLNDTSGLSMKIGGVAGDCGDVSTV